MSDAHGIILSWILFLLVLNWICTVTENWFEKMWKFCYNAYKRRQRQRAARMRQLRDEDRARRYSLDVRRRQR